MIGGLVIPASLTSLAYLLGLTYVAKAALTTLWAGAFTWFESLILGHHLIISVNYFGVTSIFISAKIRVFWWY
jgi:hypothetical protein